MIDARERAERRAHVLAELQRELAIARERHAQTDSLERQLRRMEKGE